MMTNQVAYLRPRMGHALHMAAETLLPMVQSGLRRRLPAQASEATEFGLLGNHNLSESYEGLNSSKTPETESRKTDAVSLNSESRETEVTRGTRRPSVFSHRPLSVISSAEDSNIISAQHTKTRSTLGNNLSSIVKTSEEPNASRTNPINWSVPNSETSSLINSITSTSNRLSSLHRSLPAKASEETGFGLPDNHNLSESHGGFSRSKTLETESRKADAVSLNSESRETEVTRGTRRPSIFYPPSPSGSVQEITAMLALKSPLAAALANVSIAGTKESVPFSSKSQLPFSMDALSENVGSISSSCALQDLVDTLIKPTNSTEDSATFSSSSEVNLDDFEYEIRLREALGQILAQDMLRHGLRIPGVF